MDNNLSIFSLGQTDNAKLPLILSAPHAGQGLPDDFLENSPLSKPALLATSDCFTDELVKIFEHIPYIYAHFARVVVDLNRPRDALDPAVIDGAPYSQNFRVKAGYGVLPRFAEYGQLIHAQKLTKPQAQARLEAYYDPYHIALKTLQNQIYKQFQTAIIFDVHSAPLESMGQTDIVLGSQFRQTCPLWLLTAVKSSFEKQGFEIAEDIPYAGGWITQSYAQSSQGKYCLQIEINRKFLVDGFEPFMPKWRAAMEDCQRKIQECLKL